MDEEQEIQFKNLETIVNHFKQCFLFLKEDEGGNCLKELIVDWKSVLRDYVKEINDLLNSLKKEIEWSLLDEMKERFYLISIDLKPMLNSLKECVEETCRNLISSTILLLAEGVHGFRQSFINDTYFEDLFNNQKNKYLEENQVRLELVYRQDCQDKALICPDESQQKRLMLIDRKNSLFSSRFGRVFHNNGRNVKKIVAYILDQKEKFSRDIDDFLDKYCAFLIAKEHCEIKKEAVFKNIAFKENVDVDKVMQKLKEFIGDMTIGAQKHWFIVYKVFLSKNWLKKSTQRLFVDQINSAFSTLLKCSTDDFHEINGYFKHNDFTEWTLADMDAPPCCEAYREIADKLDLEFQESKYAKPGTFINARKIEKFR